MSKMATPTEDAETAGKMGACVRAWGRVGELAPPPPQVGWALLAGSLCAGGVVGGDPFRGSLAQALPGFQFGLNNTSL